MPLAGGAEANYLTAANVAEARSKLGERGEELDTLIVHPSVAYYLYQVGMLTFSTSALSASGAVTWGGGGVGIGAREVGEFAGCASLLTHSQHQRPDLFWQPREFRCYLMKSGTILEGVQQDLRIEADRNVLSKQDVLSVDYHSTYHVMGTKWTTPLTTRPTQTCVLAGNWAATYDIDLIPSGSDPVNRPYWIPPPSTRILIMRAKKALPLGGATFFLRYMAATINATLKSATANSYVTLAEANTYFETVPSSTQWDNKTDDNKNRALISATRWIDTLNFYGDRCDADQALSWPRNNYHVDRVELGCSSDSKRH